MDEVVDAVSNNIRIIFGIFSKLSHDPRSSYHRFRFRQQRPASVNRSGMESRPGVSQAAYRFVLRLQRLFTVVGGVIVELEGTQHFGRMRDRENQLAVVSPYVHHRLSGDLRHA
jgi:hypothetical protein